MKDYDILCNKVFTTPDGQQLLEQMFERYCHRELFDPDPLKMARNTAEHDLIIHITGVIKHGGRRDTDTG